MNQNNCIACGQSTYEVDSVKNFDTGLVEIRIVKITPGKAKRGIILTVSDDAMYEFSEGESLPRRALRNKL